MIIGKTLPLEIASQVLQPETVHAVRQERQLGNSAYLILDRWALNEPEELLKLEEKSTLVLLNRLYEQQEQGRQALSSSAAVRAQEQGASEWEILEMLGVDTRVRTRASSWAPLN